MTQKGRGLFIVSFLAPAVLIYGFFVVWPLIQAFAFSTYRWRGISAHKKFVGAENFVKLSHDEAFGKAIRNNLTLLVVGGIVIIGISVALAHAMQARGTMPKALRSVILLPQMISLVVVAILWTFIFNPNFGLLTAGLKAVGLGGWVHTWLGDPKTALPSVGIAFVWYAVGFYTMLFATALKSLPEEVGEAASLDGAIGLRRFWQVTWPMLWSVKRIAVVHLTITVVNVFALVFLMTQGGPDRATEVLLTYLYESAFRNSQFGYATAIAVVNFVLVMILSGLILVAFRRDPQEPRKVQP
ncbi:carbohydrate ABC transporter permease [Fimbriimonas ginsengisoli]|uniref:Putative permease protein n=1 Tax=Fimbriimonas ginsengisoli Gsoil 348 TaxID=661478 RepID=A0A068NN08_FIMGI|nr:sugar ABC transporter permease [Fimbriimonas ginsengisoli]AIE84787.1 putative permease protein [Fimbriimonas ginsengisoli Gsoil 348]